MFGGKKNLHLSFARVSPGFCGAGSVLTLAGCYAGENEWGSRGHCTVRRKCRLHAIFAGEEQRAALNSQAYRKTHRWRITNWW